MFDDRELVSFAAADPQPDIDLAVNPSEPSIDEVAEELTEVLNQHEGPLSPWQAIKIIFSYGLSTGLSYTFSFQMVFIILLLNLTSENNEEVAATTLISTTLSLLVTLSQAPLFAMGIKASLEKGEVDRAEREGSEESEIQVIRDRLAGIYRNGLMISVVVAPPIMVSMIFSKSWLTGLLGQDDTVAELTQDYLRASFWMIPFMQGKLCSEQIALAFGCTKSMMGIALTTFALSTALAVWLEFGGLGIPALGAVGVAYAYSAESLLTAALFASFIGHRNLFNKYRFFNLLHSFKGNLAELGQLLKLAMPISFSVLTSLCAAASMAIFAGLLGTLEQASWAFVTGLSAFMLIFSLAFSQTTAQELGRRIGAEQFISASRAGIYGLATTLAVITPLPIIAAIDPNLLMTIFHNDEDDIRSILTYLVPISAAGIVLSTGLLNLLQQFRTLDEPTKSTAVFSGGLFLGIATSFALGLYTKLGIYGVALGYVLGNALPFLLGLGPWWTTQISPSQLEKRQQRRERQNNDSGISFAKCGRHCFFGSHNPSEQSVNEEERYLINDTGAEDVRSTLTQYGRSSNRGVLLSESELEFEAAQVLSLAFSN